jgi:hypothetical protein
MSRATLRATLFLAGTVVLAALLSVGAALHRTGDSPGPICSACRS